MVVPCRPLLKTSADQEKHLERSRRDSVESELQDLLDMSGDEDDSRTTSDSDISRNVSDVGSLSPSPSPRGISVKE